MRTTPVTRTLCGLTLLGCVIWSAPADASGFSVARFGGEHGHPTTTNPTAIYYNPAGLAEAKGFHIFVDGTMAIRRASYEHRAPTVGAADTPEPAGAEGANVGKGKLFNIIANPMFGASAELTDGFVLGAGFYVPIGGSSVWDKNDKFKNQVEFPGAVDGPARWYSIEGTIKSTYYSLGAAYKIPGTGLSVGVSGNLIQSVINTMRARLTDGTNNIDAEGRSWIDSSGWQWGFGAGAMYEAMPEQLWIGASYQSRPNVSGGMTLDGTLTNHFGGPQAPSKVDVTQDLPDIIRLGARFRPTPEVELRVFGDYTRWSALKEQNLCQKGKPCEAAVDGGHILDGAGNEVDGVLQRLVRNWDDAFGVRLGASYWLKPELELMGGLGYDSNAIPDKALDPALMDFHDIMVAVGARYQVAEPVFVALNYMHFFYFSRDTTNKSENDEWVPPSRGPDAGGKYTQAIDAINLNVEFVF